MANREDGRVAINSCDDNASTQWIDVSHHGALAQVRASKNSRLTPSICPARLPNKFNLDFEPLASSKQRMCKHDRQNPEASRDCIVNFPWMSFRAVSGENNRGSNDH